MIISASRRTDIPTYYSDWFLNRVKDGYLLVRNPMNAHQVSRISLSPDVVDCIVFWTKNPTPMISCLDELKDYCYYFQYTLTGYGKDVESNLPDKRKVLIPSFIKLSEVLGLDRVIWRYDPILLTEKYTAEYHIKAFEEIAKTLKGYTKKVVISFVDIYQKNKKNMEQVKSKTVTNNEWIELAGNLKALADKYDLQIATCSEEMDLSSVGIEHNACIDKDLIERLTGAKIKAKKDKTQRPECLCAESIDVGAYNTCRNGCKYCYANFSYESVLDNSKRYDVNSPMLCDAPREDDKITDRPMKSLLDRQLSFDL